MKLTWSLYSGPELDLWPGISLRISAFAFQSGLAVEVWKYGRLETDLCRVAH